MVERNLQTSLVCHSLNWYVVWKLSSIMKDWVHVYPWDYEIFRTYLCNAGIPRNFGFFSGSATEKGFPASTLGNVFLMKNSSICSLAEKRCAKLQKNKHGNLRFFPCYRGIFTIAQMYPYCIISMTMRYTHRLQMVHNELIIIFLSVIYKSWENF